MARGLPRLIVYAPAQPRSSRDGFQSMKSSPKRLAQRSSSVSPIKSMLSRISRSARSNGSQLYSATRYSRERPAARTSVATPSAPTSRSMNGMSPFVRMQLIRGGAALVGSWPIASVRLVDEVGGHLDRIGDRVTHGRFSIDRLLAAPNLVLGRAAVNGHGVPDVAHAGPDRLVMPEHA